MRFVLFPFAAIALSACAAEMTPEEDACMAQATREVPQRLDYAGIDLNHEIRMRAYRACLASK